MSVEVAEETTQEIGVPVVTLVLELKHGRVRTEDTQLVLEPTTDNRSVVFRLGNVCCIV